ncbi:hypothetical protein Gohar_006547 [Gossypium harknessii]|uniref:RNase H type-1 domain-containing protein n=1 Tax=Gossypium harknessii TaxID=34285 RepID=A0A7J9GFV1_9ROSI|nr:hypothetical protein [Gossypium harknessii]
MTIGEGTMFQVEARAVLKGLHLAWDKGFQKLKFECDNTLLIEIILATCAADSRLTELRLIHNMLIRPWEVRVRHIPQAQNIVVDHLTKIIDPELLHFHLLEEPWFWETQGVFILVPTTTITAHNRAHCFVSAFGLMVLTFPVPGADILWASLGLLDAACGARGLVIPSANTAHDLVPARLT